MHVHAALHAAMRLHMGNGCIQHVADGAMTGTVPFIQRPIPVRPASCDQVINEVVFIAHLPVNIRPFHRVGIPEPFQFLRGKIPESPPGRFKGFFLCERILPLPFAHDEPLIFQPSAQRQRKRRVGQFHGKNALQPFYVSKVFQLQHIFRQRNSQIFKVAFHFFLPFACSSFQRDILSDESRKITVSL